MLGTVTLTALPGIPEVQSGDDLAGLIVNSLEKAKLQLQAHDVVVIAQKVVSKAEGRAVSLKDVVASPKSIDLANELNVDARKVEVILAESASIVRTRAAAGPDEKGLLITKTLHGFICANAGVDESNTGAEEVIITLPIDPDASAEKIRSTLEKRFNCEIGVIVTDTFGRPWRLGEVNVCIGLSGVPALLDLMGLPDRDGRIMNVSMPALGDEIAAASGLVSAKSKGLPVTLLRGLDWKASEQTGQSFLRPEKESVF